MAKGKKIDSQFFEIWVNDKPEFAQKDLKKVITLIPKSDCNKNIIYLSLYNGGGLGISINDKSLESSCDLGDINTLKLILSILNE